MSKMLKANKQKTLKTIFLSNQCMNRRGQQLAFSKSPIAVIDYQSLSVGPGSDWRPVSVPRLLPQDTGVKKTKREKRIEFFLTVTYVKDGDKLVKDILIVKF